MDVCRLDQGGEVLVHRNMTADPEAFLNALAPSRQGLVVAVACRFPWYGLADRWAAQGISFVLGPALSMKALHGGQAKNAQSDAPQRAQLLRGGRLPPAAVSPATRRATRDVLRHRMPLTHQRAALLTPGPHTQSPYHLPAMGTKRADTATRDGGADRGAAPAVPQRCAVALALLTSDEARLGNVERRRLKTARHHDAPPPLSVAHRAGHRQEAPPRAAR